MIGLIETILNNKFGTAIVIPAAPFVEYRWRHHRNTAESVLFKMPACDLRFSGPIGALATLYSDVAGGFLVGDSLKIAMAGGPKVFGLYDLAELHSRQEVRRASDYDQHISYFMDAANVWYYGVKGHELYEYDAETDELTLLGAVEMEIGKLIDKWDEAKSAAARG